MFIMVNGYDGDGYDGGVVDWLVGYKETSQTRTHFDYLRHLGHSAVCSTDIVVFPWQDCNKLVGIMGYSGMTAFVL